MQIADLGKRLNLALANKVAGAGAVPLGVLRRLREVLGNRPDIRIVGDRFVFQSEVLFPPASADLGPEAKHELDLLAEALKEIAGQDPAGYPLGAAGRRPYRQAADQHAAVPLELGALDRARHRRGQVSDRAGHSADRLAAAGFAEFQPIDTGSTDDAYARTAASSSS